ncbi:alpha-galactosidase [Pedobacter sp. KBW01]|uniref:glycoside hydrolase family 36 protein n=1 Tax=Pedobacter sp. KBW01 TaxID=2153364 RepID=UPI000F5B61BD|nr:glycoside hydrolase family 36 protein [Pedobacter sp. KBW01]RQO79456.1 alpha-galactosidase [Pedobacter sp. KBW01]
MMRNIKRFIMLCLMALVTINAVATGTPHQKAVDVFLSGLKQSKPRVILADGSQANAASVLVNRIWKGKLCALSIKNTSQQALSIREVVVFDFNHGLSGNTPIYGESFQKLGQIGGTLAKPEDWGSYSDRAHYKIPEPEGLRTAYGMLTLQPQQADRLLVATTSCNRFISRFSFDAKRLRISMDCENLLLKPGETWNLEEFMAVAGPEREKLYDQLTRAIAVHHPKLEFKPIPMGWCSWLCFGPKVTAKNVSDNTGWIANNLPELKYVQIDDGYQPWMGDWLEAGDAFGGGVSNVLKEIKDKKLEPAIWVAPFIASPQSRLFKEHPDWMVKDESGKPMRSDKVGFGGWRQGPWYALDGTHPEVQKYFTELFKTMREKWGCTYFKLDANYWGAIHGGVHYDKSATRIEAYRRGMEAIRKGAGDAFLLGCNHPIWASLGLVHGSRSSMDISHSWDSFKSIGKENLLRSWQNGRFWWNDPDCIVLTSGGSNGVMDNAGNFTGDKNAKPGIPENEFLFHAASIYATGGLLLSGDDLPTISPEHLVILKKLIPPTGVAARFENEKFEVGNTTLKGETVYSVFNWSNTPVKRTVKLPAGKYRLTNKFTGKAIGVFQGEYVINDMAGRSGLLITATRVAN